MFDLNINRNEQLLILLLQLSVALNALLSSSYSTVIGQIWTNEKSWISNAVFFLKLLDSLQEAVCPNFIDEENLQQQKWSF